MPDSPAIPLSPTMLAERETMRCSLLRDLDRRMAAAGGTPNYLFTTPRPELDRMRRRLAIVLEQASAPAGYSAEAKFETERLLATSSLLETEVACRDLVAQDAVDERGELAYDIPDELRTVTQNNLATRLMYHDQRSAAPYASEASFHHLQASWPYREHLVAQQFDAYKRGLEVVECKQTQVQLGEKIHDDLTHQVVMTQADELPGVGCEDRAALWQVSQIAEHLAGQSAYVTQSVGQFRHVRQALIAETGQGPYSEPNALAAFHPPVWDGAAQVVDAAVDRAHGRESAIDMADADLNRSAGIASGTSARDAYLVAGARAEALGMALTDPRMRRGLVLGRLEHTQARIREALPEDFAPGPKPRAWRAAQRAQWELAQEAVRALDDNAEWQEQLRAELGPNSDQIARSALALDHARDRIIGQTAELRRNAIDEELAREPEWLTETLGPRPEIGAGRWQTLAAQLADNRMRLLVTNDTDPGIRPDTALAAQLEQFHASVAQSLTKTPGFDFGM